MMSDKQTWSTLIKRLIGWLNPNSAALEDTASIPTTEHDHGVIGEPFTIAFEAANTALAVRVQPLVPPVHALAALRLPVYQGVLIMHGGAGQMEPHYMDAVRDFLITSISPLAEEYRLLIVDGGTQSGTSRILGEAREAIHGTYPLVGVVPEGRVSYPGGSPSAGGRNALNSAHSHFILVQGEEFGDESSLVVGLLRAAGRPGAAFVINGGDIVLAEVHMHSAQGNILIALNGSGRVADSLADPTSIERRQLPASVCLHVTDVTDPQGCVDLLTRVLHLSL